MTNRPKSEQRKLYEIWKKVNSFTSGVTLLKNLPGIVLCKMTLSFRQIHVKFYFEKQNFWPLEWQQ